MKRFSNKDEFFSYWRDFYISRIKRININTISIRNNVQVSLPVRLNLSAGWNDTPPYSNENIGSILNMSYLIDNKRPIFCKIERIKKEEIIIKSDGNSIEKINKINDMYSKNNEVIKSSILASGLVPIDNNYNLKDLLKKIGGFKITTKAKNIPIGSGLGTSSIVIAATIKAIYKYLGISITDYELFIKTAIAEQIMGTGGGYQDQVGALIPGIKLIKFTPKNNNFPSIEIEKVKLSNKTKNHINKKLKIIYSGKTRLAKNLLQQVMGNYYLKDEKTLRILKEINYVSKEMKDNLEKDNLEQFGKNMIKSYELCKEMYPSFTNKEIEEKISEIKDKSYGYMIAGAGGGGYLIVLYK